MNEQQTLESIERWQRAADPTPTHATLAKGFGYFLEEFNETLKAVKLDSAHDHLRKDAWMLIEHLANSLKAGQAMIEVMDRFEVCDGIADVIVTGVGFGYRAGMNIPKASAMVDTANWAKYVDGQPLRDANGKVVKPQGWTASSLKGCF